MRRFGSILTLALYSVSAVTVGTLVYFWVLAMTRAGGW